MSRGNLIYIFLLILLVPIAIFFGKIGGSVYFIILGLIMIVKPQAAAPVIVSLVTRGRGDYSDDSDASNVDNFFVYMLGAVFILLGVILVSDYIA